MPSAARVLPIERPQTSVVPATYLPGLNGIRAIAVSMVCFCHLGQNWSWTENLFWRRVAYNAGFGVDMFFVLSGFLITYLLIQEEARRGGVSLTKFYQRRALRILPPAFLFLSVLAILVANHVLEIPAIDFLRCATFVRNWWFPSVKFTDHFWSLAIEEQFYLVWPLVFIWLGSRRRLKVVVALMAAEVVWYRLAHFVAPPVLDNPFRTDMKLLPILTGCAAALAFTDDYWRARLVAWSRPWGAWLALAVITVLVATPFYEVPVLRSLVGHFAVLAVAYLVMYPVLHPESRVTAALEWKPIHALGAISYSLYVWQELFLPPLVKPLGWANEFPFNLIFPLIIATLTYRYLELPLRRFRKY